MANCLLYSQSVAELASCRSFLFVPGLDAARIRKAVNSGADAVIFDLEDSVAESKKHEARDCLRATLTGLSAVGSWLVRVNAVSTPHFRADMEQLRGLPLDGIVVPKVSVHALRSLPGSRARPTVVALIETPAGLAQVRAIASHPAVHRLQLGAGDLSAALGLETRSDGLELLHARSALVLASALARCPPPIDSVFTSLHDLDGVERDACLSRSLGFTAKACIYPTHVDLINRVFAPSQDELDQARALVERFDAADGTGVIEFDGQMIDRPIVERARSTMERSKRG